MSQPEVPDQNSPMVVTFMTTEHFVVQTARSAGITETVGRAAIYLAAVSSGLVALAFTGQFSRLGAAFYIFGLRRPIAQPHVSVSPRGPGGPR